MREREARMRTISEKKTRIRDKQEKHLSEKERSERVTEREREKEVKLRYKQHLAPMLPAISGTPSSLGY